ncbi:MAG: response regulator [Sedimenticola sp.]
MSDQIKQSDELKEAFIEHLPERISSIEKTWNELSEQGWNQDLFQQFFMRVQNMAGSCGKFGLIELNESIFALETFLSSFVGSSASLSDEHKQRGRELIDAAKVAMERDRVLAPGSAGQRGGKLAFYVRLSDALAPGLEVSLQENGFTLLTFIRPDDLEGEIQKRLPDIIILDAHFLPQLEGLGRELKLQQERQSRKVPILCLSQTKDLKQRLHAMRIGVTAYVVAPFATRELLGRVLELTSPPEDHHRILIVEDDPTQAQFAASILNKGGMKTMAVTEPLKVPEALDQFRPDLVLMDLYMPDANGIELTTIIREHPDFFAVPIVFLSGEQDPDKKLNALSFGGDDFLSKPIRPKHLISTITNRVQRARALSPKADESTIRDSVSGLHNSRYFFEELEKMSIASAGDRPGGGVLLVEIASIDKRRALEEGKKLDALLVQLGHLMAAHTESQDIACRLSTNSFAIIAVRPHIKNLQELATGIYDAIETTPFTVEGEQKRLESAIGICPFDHSPGDASEILGRAEKASTYAWGKEGQRIAIYTPEIDQGPDHVVATEMGDILRQAIESNSFQIMFRPLADNQGRTLEKYQIRIRLQQLPAGQADSRAWRQVALEEGLLGSIDRKLIEHALSTLELKRNEGKHVELFIEQSVQSMQQMENIDWMKEQLRARHLVGTGLVFEYPIAELGTDLKTAKRFISQLRSAGIGVCLSKFGANSAALRVLQYLEANYVCLAPQILTADEEEAESVISLIRQHRALIILPRLKAPKKMPEPWKAACDLMPMETET